jgi:hypothetical protein
MPENTLEVGIKQNHEIDQNCYYLQQFDEIFFFENLPKPLIKNEKSPV